MAIVSVEEVIAFTGISEERAKQLIKEAESFAEAKCNRGFEYGVHTDQWTGDGGQSANLRYYPLESIISLKIDGETVPSDSYFIIKNPGIINLKGDYKFKSGKECECTYKGGYKDKDLPGAVRLAILLFIQWLEKVVMQRLTGIQTLGDSVGSRSYESEVPSYIIKLLEPYYAYDF